MNTKHLSLAVLRLFCSSDPSRRTLWYPYGDDGRAYATDGRFCIRLDGVDVPARDRGGKPFPARQIDELLVPDTEGEKLELDRLDEGATVVLAAARDYHVSRAYRGDEDVDPVDEFEDDVKRSAFVKIGSLTFAADKIATITRALGWLYLWPYRFETVPDRGMLRIWSADGRLGIALMAIRDGVGANGANVGMGESAATYNYDTDEVVHWPID